MASLSQFIFINKFSFKQKINQVSFVGAFVILGILSNLEKYGYTTRVSNKVAYRLEMF